MLAKNIDDNQAKDSGLAIVLILLLIAWVKHKEYLLFPAIICLVLTMTLPAIFKLWARVWFGLSHALGTVVSKVLLTIVFWVVVVPIGRLRRMSGRDAMRGKLWKKDGSTVFIERNHTFTKEDLERPY